MTVLDRRDPDGPSGEVIPAARARTAMRRRRRIRRLVLAGLLSALAVAGLVAVARSSMTAWQAAQRGRAELTAFEQAVRAGDVPAGRRHLRMAQQELARARVEAAPVRVFGRIPWLGRGGVDAGLLLDSAQQVAAAGDQVLALQAAATGQPLVRDGRLRVDRIRALQPITAALLARAEQAQRDLASVRGGGLSPHTAALRDGAKGQVDQLVDTARLADLAIRALPASFGAPHDWLLTTLNYAELHGGGGAPLGLATLRVSNGGFEVTSRGQTSTFDQTQEKVPFTAAAGDPWLRHRHREQFVNGNLSPDFATDGEEMLRLFEGLFHREASGVIAVDPTAIGGVLKLTGPVHTPGSGVIDAGNVVQRLLVDSYQGLDGDIELNKRRHQANEALMDATFHRMLQLSLTSDQLHGLLRLARAGHLRLYTRDPDLQQLIRTIGLSGELTQFTGDQVGVYTFNLNASKVDVWQRRSVVQDVTLAADGSAQVTRTIRVTNAVQRGCPNPDTGSGYDTCISEPFVMAAFPVHAQDVSMTVRDAGQVPATAAGANHRLDEAGRRIWSARVYLKRGETTTLVLRYRLPAGLLPDGYRLRWDGQPIANDPSLTVRVHPAPGIRMAGAGWLPQAGTLVASLPLVGTGDLWLKRLPNGG